MNPIKFEIDTNNSEKQKKSSKSLFKINPSDNYFFLFLQLILSSVIMIFSFMFFFTIDHLEYFFETTQSWSDWILEILLQKKQETPFANLVDSKTDKLWTKIFVFLFSFILFYLVVSVFLYNLLFFFSSADKLLKKGIIGKVCIILVTIGILIWFSDRFFNQHKFIIKKDTQIPVQHITWENLKELITKVLARISKTDQLEKSKFFKSLNSFVDEVLIETWWNKKLIPSIHKLEAFFFNCEYKEKV